MATNESPYSEEDALVAWVNTFPLSRPIKSLRDLNNGHAVWEMLREIDDGFTGNLPNLAESESAKLQNLQHIYRHVQNYLEEGGRTFNAISEEELRNMSLDKGTSYSFKFLELIIGIMLVSPKLPDLIPAIEGLPLPTRKVLMSFMQEIENLNDDASGENADAHDYHDDAAARKQSRASSLVAPETKGDHLLELEEQYAHLMAQLKRRENEYADLEERFAQTQKTNGELKAQSTRKDEELKDQRSLNSERAQSSLRDLEFKISEQEEIITSKELELAQSQSRVVSLQREHEKFSESKKSFQKLDDDLKIMRVELEKQTKKANTADHYLRKLQLNQSIENERDKMRLELEDARKSLKMTDDLRQENAALQVSNNEKSQTISQIERDLLEHQRTKKQLRINYDSLTQEVHGLNERFAQDQETIADLKDRHGSSESHSSPTIVNGGLESELADTSKYENQMQVSNILVRWLRILTYNRKIRITELEKQNQALSSDAFSSNTQLAVLQKQLESAQEATADHIGHTSDMRQELLALETSFGQIRQGHPIEGTEIFQRMRDQLKAKQHRCHDLEVQLSKVCNSLGNAQNDRMSSAENYMMISALGIDLLTGSIMDKSNHETVQEDRYQTSLTDVDPQAERRLSGDDARMDSNDVDIDNMSVDRLTQIIQRASSEDAESQKSWAELFVSNIERGRERLAKQQKQIEEQNSVIKTLESQVQSQNASQPPASTKSVDENIYAQNLERENRLMASAFHNLAGRLQMNNVVLQRRAEAPKSWLGRQRKAIEGPVGIAR